MPMIPTNENKRAPIEIGDRPLRRDPPPADNPEHRGNFMSKNTIAYLINQYPKVSHTFIRREIAALEREGFEIMRIALRGWNDGAVVDPEDLRERARTRYVLKGGVLRLLSATLSVAVRNPRRFAAALWVALCFTRRSYRPAVLHIVTLAEACQLLTWLSDGRVSHVHAHFGGNSAEVVLYAHLLSGLSYSFTVHGPDEFDGPSFIRLPEKVRNARFVVAISSFTRGQLFRWVDKAHWSKIKVVHCGLDKSFLDAARPLAASCTRLICVGRLCAQKGQLLLLSAASLLVREGVRFDLVLAGDGEMRAELEKSIGAQGLSAFVRITGWLSNNQVRDEILAARALVLPSFAEGLPVAIMEAMALQRPVLAPYVGGIPELVTHGKEGWLFPAGSVNELAAAMRECIEAPVSEIAHRGAQARERVLTRHDIDKEAKLLAELFRESTRES